MVLLSSLVEKTTCFPLVLLEVAAQDFRTAMQHTLGANYQLVGKITTNLSGVKVLDIQKGTLSASLNSSGTWHYQFTNQQKQHLAQLMSGKSIPEAQKILSKEDQVADVKITTQHGFWLWDSVPTNTANITFIVG